MRIRYYVCAVYRQSLFDFLEKYQIPYETKRLEGPNVPGTWLRFSLWSTQKDIDFYLRELKKVYPYDPQVTAEYTKSEFERAKFLEIYPTRQSIDIINEEDAFQYSCIRVIDGDEVPWHIKQAGTITIAKEPSIGGRSAFWSESTGLSELFVDNRIVTLAKENALAGIEFKNVKLRKGGYSEKLFQMTSPYILGKEQICTGYGEKIRHCPVCGEEQYDVDDTYQMHLDFEKLQGPSDLYVTEPIWGERIPSVRYIISQRFYQLLKQNKLAGKLLFVPVGDKT